MYKLYYNDCIEMNGKGIKYIIYDDEKLSYCQGMELLIDEFSNEFPDFYNEDYNIHIYVNADYSGYSLDIDYNSNMPSMLLTNMNNWLRLNTMFVKINEVK